MASIDGVDVPLVAAEDSSWRAGGLFDYLQISLRTSGDPAPRSIRLCDFGTVKELTSLPTAPAAAECILGRYRCAAAGVTVEIIEGGVAETARQARSRRYRIFDWSRWRASVWRALP